jgi:hypothetical protein
MNAPFFVAYLSRDSAAAQSIFLIRKFIDQREDENGD